MRDFELVSAADENGDGTVFSIVDQVKNMQTFWAATVA